MKLIISKLYIKNFRSIGDKVEEIDLLKRGAVLICGMNGSGKTTIIESLVWCLFGKLSDGQNPGDNIINWDSGRNCMVKIITADGYEICRTRKYEGYSDLIITKDNNPIEDGDSTNANAQAALNNLFNLDFNSFISSLFFGQASGSFLTLSDSKKKSVIENLFGLSKLTCYADVTKERINKCEELYESLKTKILDIEKNIESKKKEIIKYESLSNEFEKQRKQTIQDQKEEISRLKENQEESIDIESLESSWETILKGNEKIKQLTEHKDKLDVELKEISNNSIVIIKNKAEFEGVLKSSKRNIEHLQKRINDWEQKKGTVCPTCEQTVEKTFVSKKIKNIEKENAEEKKILEQEIEEYSRKIEKADENLDELNKQKEKTQNKIDAIVLNINKLKKSINKAKDGKMTLIEAKKHNEIINGTNREIEKCKILINEEENKNNNYGTLIKESEDKIKEFNKEINQLNLRCEDISKEATHLTYIYRAHSDKKNLRSYLISGSIPILNDRLSYYFNELNIQSNIQFNQSLQIKSDKWPYSLHSGGEKKRVDLALMCALYDTFTSIYGQKSNILVLDELDKEFDKDGVEEYVRLIIDDLAHRIDTILTISHKDEINFAFPTQIKVQKENDQSFLEQ